MIDQSLIEIENHLAIEMLQETLTNATIKQSLKAITKVLIFNVLIPIRTELSQVKQFTDLSLPYQEAIKHLAVEHTAEGRQYGAVMPEVASSKDIICSIDKIQNLLNAQENAVENIDTIKTIDQLAVVIKIMIELGCLYYEAPQIYAHHEMFDNLKNMISPDIEEKDIRILRTELGEPPMFALTYGIGTKDKDLGLQSRGEGRITGKSIFGTVKMKKRLKLLCAEFDRTHAANYAEKMAYYKIPLNKSEREPIEVYAKKWKTCFEKSIKDPLTKISSPLIASVSGATARVLVTLQDLGIFNKSDGSFDFDKAQIIANCLMGFIVHAGHHATVEVAEPYNRLLDYVAINNLEKSCSKPVMIEKNMPYYHTGNYYSFFNRAYADKIIDFELDPNANLNTNLAI